MTLDSQATPPPPKANRIRRRGVWWKLGLPIMAIVLLSWYFWGGGSSGDSREATFTAVKGPLRIAVTEGGSIAAKESQMIRNEVRGQTKILTIVEEGYMVTEDDVKNGKVLVTLDSSNLVEKQTSEEIEYQSARASFTEAKESFEIQIKQNESDIREGKLDAKFARMDFEKYVGVDLANKILKERELDDPAILKDDYSPMIASLPGEPDIASMPDGAAPPPDAVSQLVGAPTPATGEAKPEQSQEGAAQPTEAPSNEQTPATVPATVDGARPAMPDVPPASAPPPVDEDVKPGELTMLAMASQSQPGKHPVDFTQYADPAKLGDGEAQQKLKKLESSLLLADQEAKLNTKNLEGTKRLAEKDYVTKQELEAEEIKARRGENDALASQIETDLFIKYDFPKSAEKYLSDYEEALSRLERIHKQSVSKLAQAEAKLKSNEARFSLQTQRRKDQIEQIAKCTIKAERPGLVVYAGSDEPWRQQEAIKEGSSVFERQDIITIPDMTQMAVSVKIHESSIKKVMKGQKATIKLDAVPDQVLTGEVTRVNVLPNSASRWMNPDVKVYDAQVSIDGVYDWLKPGLSAEVEIMVQELPDVVYVPLQAVSSTPEGRVCYVRTLTGSFDKRIVETGEFNDNFIEVKKGVEPGDVVLLRSPELPQGQPGQPEAGKPDAPKGPGQQGGGGRRERPAAPPAANS